MLRMSKLTDYGTLVLARLSADDRLQTAAALADATRLPLPTVSKVLKALAQADLVSSVRGASGGYRLTRSARQITAADILDALEGPLALTECSTDAGHCRIESTCTVGHSWQRVNLAIRRALEDISLDDLQHSHQIVARFDLAALMGSVAATGKQAS